MKDGWEITLNTNPVDADSDDDGLNDHEDTYPLDPDSDKDGLNDGLELGRTSGIGGGTSGGSDANYRVNYVGTASFWQPDTDPSTTTNPQDPDTDNDALCDGNLDVTSVCTSGEDLNVNGAVDGGETDPNISN